MNLKEIQEYVQNQRDQLELREWEIYQKGIRDGRGIFGIFGL